MVALSRYHFTLNDEVSHSQADLYEEDGISVEQEINLKKILIFTITILLLSHTSLQADTKGKFDYYTLALSWMPAFCESKPNKRECQNQDEKRFDAYHFILHGLWPGVKGDKRHTYGYCDVSKSVIKKDKKRRWCNMPKLDLSQTVRKNLNQFMPGTASCLQRHEWYKHGSCSGLSEEDYYALSNQLVEKFSKTDFSQYIAKHVGKKVKRKTLLKKFDKEFGKGSRSYLVLRCKKVRRKSLLTEIQIHLKKNFRVADDFGKMFLKEKLWVHGNCPRSFKIDEVGV